VAHRSISGTLLRVTVRETHNVGWIGNSGGRDDVARGDTHRWLRNLAKMAVMGHRLDHLSALEAKVDALVKHPAAWA
jgi:hypothetical protein